MSVMTGFVIGQDREQLLENTRRILERWGSDTAPEEALARYESRGLAGTPDQLVEGLKRLEEAGVERVMLQHIAHDDLETIALLGRSVVPQL
jgi:alkanesulfonate monooxygenase SsuD/methylene tetrahydromethanopterin reductase-like flavin-dependent oxidoreductase (luciferase family)